VVSVDPAATIRTVAPGVATITATVTYQGVTASTSFVVAVRNGATLDD
jgi:beta-glucosidase